VIASVSIYAHINSVSRRLILHLDFWGDCFLLEGNEGGCCSVLALLLLCNAAILVPLSRERSTAWQRESQNWTRGSGIAKSFPSICLKNAPILFKHSLFIVWSQSAKHLRGLLPLKRKRPEGVAMVSKIPIYVLTIHPSFLSAPLKDLKHKMQQLELKGENV